MKPINFPQSTKVLQRPSTMSESECQSLPVWNDGKQCVSCWKPTFKERINIFFTGKVWLGVLSGKTQPPVFVSGIDVFEKPSVNGRLWALVLQIKESVSEALDSIKDAAKQPDKRKHFIVGWAISVILGSLLGCWVGFIIGSLAGIVKEWWDSKGHGTVEVMDAIFTMFGAMVSVPFTYFVRSIIF